MTHLGRFLNTTTHVFGLKRPTTHFLHFLLKIRWVKLAYLKSSGSHRFHRHVGHRRGPSWRVRRPRGRTEGGAGGSTRPIETCGRWNTKASISSDSFSTNFGGMRITLYVNHNTIHCGGRAMAIIFHFGNILGSLLVTNCKFCQKFFSTWFWFSIVSLETVCFSLSEGAISTTKTGWWDMHKE